MTQMIDFAKGWDGIKPNLNSLVNNIRGLMTYFPNCCSTGVLQNVSASRPGIKQAGVYTGTMNYVSPLPSKSKLTEAKSIYKLIKSLDNNPYFIFPEEVGIWYCMSLIRRKIEFGADDSENTAYGNYKAAQITMFDRLLEDKNPKKGFRFLYNMIFSIDHFQQWLSEQGDQYGEVYMSPPVPGGHGARVRGCIFTPNLEAMQKYEEERIELLRTHIINNYEFLSTRSRSGAQKNQLDAVASKW